MSYKTKHSYGFPEKLSRWSSAFMWSFVTALMLFYYLLIAGDYLLSISRIDLTFIVVLVSVTLFWLPYVAFPCLSLAFFSNYNPDVWVAEGGLYIQYFLRWRRFIPWDDIVAIRRNILPLSSSRVVLVRHLTLVHRLFGLFAGSTSPAFLIGPRIGLFDHLIETIEQKVENERNSKN